jgi:cytochrome c-type biogenesis protein CcmF
MTPIGLILLLLTGIAPLLAWRRSTVANLREQFLWPVVFMAAVTAIFVGLGVRVWSSGICFALCAFVTATITQEFVRGARVRKAATGTDLFTAAIGLVMRERRRYGGYIVHLGIVLMYLGFAGEGFKTDQQVLLKLGQETAVRHYTVRNNGIKVTDDGQKQMVTGHVAVSVDGKAIGTMYPARWFFRKHEEQPTTEVAIRRTAAEDLYLVMPAYDVNEQSMSLQVVVTPLVNWIWAGFGILVLGTGIALLPERAFAFALGRVPAEASTT